MLMISTGSILRNNAPRHGEDLSAAVSELNRHLEKNSETGKFMTLFYGLLDDKEKTLSWTSAGHDPAIWYKAQTGDITELTVEDCACGRTSVRMAKISGRTDDMIIVRGVNVFPSQIEAVLLQVEGVQPHYLIVVDRESGAMDTLEIRVEVSEEIFSDKLGALADLQRRLERVMSDLLAISARVKLVEPHSIERSMGKAKRVIDKRDVYGT